MAKQMTADERRRWHEQAIDEGGSVFHGGTIHTTKATLPSKGDLAATDEEVYEALDDIEQRRQALNDEEARVRSRAGRGLTAESDDLPKDFPGRSALVKAGYTKLSQVNELSEEELTEISGIGPAAAAKIIEARK